MVRGSGIDSEDKGERSPLLRAPLPIPIRHSQLKTHHSKPPIKCYTSCRPGSMQLQRPNLVRTGR